MARRIEIELTSTRDDGKWNWRAAGARQPRGVLDGELLYQGAKAGDVVRADAEFEIEGIVITSVLAPKEKRREEPQRIEVIGSSSGDTPGVTTQLVGKGGRGDRPDRGRDRPDRARDRPDRPRPDRPDRGDGARTGAGGRDGRPAGAAPSGERRGPRPGGDRPAQGDRVAAGASRQPSGPRRDGPGHERSGRDRPGRGDSGREGESKGRGGPSRTGEAAGSRARRLNPGHTHRQSVMASLPPEEQAVAEQVLRGGIPAVRTAIHLERERATSEGRPVPDAEQLLALAEGLVPRLKTAEWHDRAEAAVRAGSEIALRDLRSVVAGADAARDDETRQLATELRAALDTRVEGLRTSWVDDLTRHLDEGRVVRALQLAGRPPDPATRLPSEVADRVSRAAGEALSSDTPPERWMALLEAAAASPVRRSVTPAGLPAEPGPDLLRAAHQQSGRIPALATMLGMSIPPPPGPRLGSAPRRPPAPPVKGPPPVGGPAAAPAVETPAAATPPAAETSAAIETPPVVETPAAIATPPVAETPAVIETPFVAEQAIEDDDAPVEASSEEPGAPTAHAEPPVGAGAEETPDLVSADDSSAGSGA